ncbi:MAG TPA: Uma2 family endonuclease [Bryobacteraceae bacterium]
MSGTATLISLDEYLNTSYEPDMDFVDGVLVSRNVGTQRHGLLQLIVGSYFRQFRQTHNIDVFAETRLRVDAASGRHRIPDVTVLKKPYQKGKVVIDSPAVIVEIQSPDDTFDDIVERCLDYDKLAVPDILVMDPDHHRAWSFQDGSLTLLSGDSVTLHLQDIVCPFAKLFTELDED